MKKFLCGFLVGLLVAVTIPVGAAIEDYICNKADYKLVINGVEYNDPDLPLMNYKGYTVGSVRKILEAAGMGINWNAELKQAEVVPLASIQVQKPNMILVSLNYINPNKQEITEKDEALVYNEQIYLHLGVLNQYYNNFVLSVPGKTSVSFQKDVDQDGIKWYGGRCWVRPDAIGMSLTLQGVVYYLRNK